MFHSYTDNIAGKKIPVTRRWLAALSVAIG